MNLLRVDYFDTAGNLVHSYLPKPIAIRPFGTVEAFVAAENTRGGTGANFIVEWSANGLITDPLIETVMVGTLGAQGFSFTSRGKTIWLSIGKPLPPKKRHKKWGCEPETLRSSGRPR